MLICLKKSGQEEPGVEVESLGGEKIKKKTLYPIPTYQFNGMEGGHPDNENSHERFVHSFSIPLMESSIKSTLLIIIFWEWVP